MPFLRDLLRDSKVTYATNSKAPTGSFVTILRDKEDKAVMLVCHFPKKDAPTKEYPLDKPHIENPLLKYDNEFWDVKKDEKPVTMSTEVKKDKTGVHVEDIKPSEKKVLIPDIKTPIKK